MRSPIIVFGLLLGTLAASLAPLPLCAEVRRVVTVDMGKILSQSIEGKALSSTLEDEMKKKQASLAARRSELDRLKAEIEKQGALLSQSARDEKRSALEKKERDFSRDVQDTQEAFNRKKGAGIEGIVKRARSVIEEIAREGGHDYVIEKDPRVVVYAVEDLDISRKVIERMDEMKVNS